MRGDFIVDKGDEMTDHRRRVPWSFTRCSLFPFPFPFVVVVVVVVVAVVAATTAAAAAVRGRQSSIVIDRSRGTCVVSIYCSHDAT